MYVVSCVFTKEDPETSLKAQSYVKDRFKMPMMRCCVAGYKEKEFTDAMPEWMREGWKALPLHIEFQHGGTMVYVCHNCMAILQETKPGVKRVSLWELAAEDKGFVFPDYKGEKITVQDCWRSHDNVAEQQAVRFLLEKMNFQVAELEESRKKTQFCGVSTLMPAPPRNLKLAPKRFVENAQGKFVPHSEARQKELMAEHCGKINTERVVAYCHYCVKGLNIGGAKALHLGSLLFGDGRV
ncbi:MAG: hypothetical protein FWG66_02285 [Spirochaetes bacterium]|nr:hypothetical protein [Spirochaetota bacterium]